MIKIIGASVVYGFAIYGLVTWLKNSQNDEDPKGEAERNREEL